MVTMVLLSHRQMQFYGSKGEDSLRCSTGLEANGNRSRAAENGSGEAQFQMGVHSLDGIGVEKVKRSRMWIRILNTNAAPFDSVKRQSNS